MSETIDYYEKNAQDLECTQQDICSIINMNRMV